MPASLDPGSPVLQCSGQPETVCFRAEYARHISVFLSHLGEAVAGRVYGAHSQHG
jgi:hypothetical protein